MRPWWLYKILKVLAIAAAATLALGGAVMALWNTLIPELFKGPVLTFWQAVGLLVLSHILLRGWGCRGHGKDWRHERWRKQFEEKMAAMTPEEREKFEEEWKGRCVGPLALVLLVAASSCGPSSSAEKALDPAVARVEVAPVIRRDVERQLTVTGSLLPGAEATVSAEVSGRVTDLHFEVQKSVRQGDELTHFDDTEYQLQLAQARAAQVQARLAAERAEQDLRQNTELLAAGGISQWVFEVSKTASEAAKAQRDASEAAVKLAEKHLKDTQVRAPISGLVTARYVNVGDYLRAPAPVAAIASVDPLKVQVAVPERFAATIRLGQPLWVSVEAYPNQTFAGQITIINPTVDPATRTFTAEGVVPNPDRRLKPGFFAKVSITTGVAEQVLVVPLEAIVTVEGKAAVYVARDGVARLTYIEIGERRDRAVEVAAGLRAEDRVLVSGHTALKDGAPISII